MSDDAAAAPAAAAETDYKPPVTGEELAACAQVLDRVSKQLKSDAGKAFYQGKACRSLRKSLAPFVQLSSSKMYGGSDMYEYETKKRLAKEAAGKRNREKQLDANYRNNSLLRQERLRKLQQVQQENDQGDLPMIADGPADVSGPAADDEPGPKRLKSAAAAPEGGQGPEGSELHKPRSCYVCKVRFKKL